MRIPRVFTAVIALGAALSAVMAMAQTGYFTARPVNPPMPLYPTAPRYMWNPAYYYEPGYQPGYAPAYQAPQPQVLPQTSSSIEAVMDSDGKVHIKWQGEPEAVEVITFTLLDPEKKVIAETKVDRLPAEARFPLTNKSAYYRVTVTYLNGTKNTITSLL